MKRYIAGLLAVICLLLSGCSTWMDGRYVSVTPHMAQGGDQTPEVNRISNADQLYEALISMVAYGTDSDVFFIQNYNQEVLHRDFLQAEYKIKDSDPIGAYALEDISYELGINGGQATLAITIQYSHSRQEILRIQKVQGMAAAKKAIESVLNKTSTDLVLYIENYQEVDFEQIVEDYAQDNPHLIIEVPQVTVDVYPEQGDDRVVELKFTYQTNRESLRNMQSLVERVFESAELYVSSDESAYEKYSHLYVFLMERYDYKLETSITPSYSLLRHGVGDPKAFAMVFAAMCRQVGLECMIVSGTRAGEPWCWNIICNEDVYYHLDLLRCVEEGAFRERSDAEMEGYVWDYSAYPDCGGETLPEITDPDETIDTTDPEDTSATTAPTEIVEPTEIVNSTEATDSAEPTAAPEGETVGQ